MALEGCKTSRGTAGTVTSFGPQGELKCLESQKHLGNNGNINCAPIISHPKNIRIKSETETITVVSGLFT